MCFENYLQLIALLKFSNQEDLLRGNDYHKGLLKTTLGGLLRGHPDRKDPIYSG